jgi:hypothetical protein
LLTNYVAFRGRQGATDWANFVQSFAALQESASLTGRLGSSAFRLSMAAASMSLAGSCFSPGT